MSESAIPFENICRLIESRLSPGNAVGGDTVPAGVPAPDAALIPALDIQKRAIIGYADAVSVYQARIAQILDGEGLRDRFAIPAWFENAEEAIFESVWGKAGMAEWWKPAYADSSSAKIIGDEIFFFSDGKMRRMPQTISAHRRAQLIRAFLLLTPAERLDRDFHEIYLLDGCRVTIFKGALAKDGLDVIIFRRYTIPEYTFEEQAARGTIPEEAIPLFHAMARVGYNVIFCGSVRSAKTTFLSTWQRLEDPSLEGVMVETDPEIPLHKLMPGAPIVQLICDGEPLKQIAKNLLRSDADYFILAEARDGIALDAAVRLARRGTGHMKMTFHTRDPLSFPEDAAVEIVRAVGGDVRETALRVAGSFDYLFHLISVPGGGKRLRGVYEIRAEDGAWAVREICRYDLDADIWRWTYRIAPDKRTHGEENDRAAFLEFDSRLRQLAGSEDTADETREDNVFYG